LKAAKRIVVLGCAGTGKTSFAGRLGEKAGCPAIILDEMWDAHGNAEGVEPFRVAIREAHAGEAWVSDGNFAVATFDIRLPHAELIIWLERPRWLCLWRAARRVWRPGESHRLADLAKVLAFIWNFDAVNRPKIEAERARHGPSIPMLRLTRDRDVTAFLESFGA